MKNSPKAFVGRKPKAVLFDLDGVLIDSIDCWLLAFNETLKKYGLRGLGKREFLRRHWGRSTEDNFKDFGLGEDAVNYCHSQQMRLISEIRLARNAKRTLEILKNRVKVGLVTNTPRENTRKILDSFGLTNCFDVVVVKEDVERGKPYPDMIIKACELLGVEPRSALVVGDTPSDLKAGKSAGCKVVGVNVKGDFTVRDLSELIPILG